MEIVKICNHPIAANTYIAYDEVTMKGVIIDPSFNISNSVNSLIQDGISISAILLTHGHFDHIAGVDPVRKALNIPVYIHKDDSEMLFSAEKNHGRVYGLEISTDPAEYIIADGETIKEAGKEFKVIHTPGHTPGSVCFSCEDCLFTGDTLFHLSIGRTDLQGGNYSEIEKSLVKLKALSIDYKIYPGHAESSSLSFEKTNNPYLSL